MQTIRPPACAQPRQESLLLSDLHLGGHVDMKLLRRDLREARSRQARIKINGDLYDLILPPDRKRYSPSSLDPSLHGCDDLINKVVDLGVELLEPYADLIDMIGCGNHDDILRHHSIDPVLLTVQRLSTSPVRKGLPPIAYGGWAGFVQYTFPRRRTFTLYYHHGWGKGGALSTSVADLNGCLAGVEGVDLIWLGHHHSRLQAHVIRHSPQGPREIRFVRTGSYLLSHQSRSPARIQKSGKLSAYAMEQGFRAHGRGGAWLSIDCSDRHPQVLVTQ